mgnify:CR=1 FL=1
MTTAARLPARVQHKCDICGRLGFYGEEGFAWARYTSILLDDLSPDDAPEACSDECKVKLQRRINDGEFVLPKIGKGPNPRVGRRKGY